MTSWPHNAYVGQKVVCISHKSSNPFSCKAPYPYPPIGAIVTISWVEFYIRFNSVVIDLIEYPAPEIGSLLRGWEYDLFKPAQSTETGMLILKKLLVPQLENV